MKIKLWFLRANSLQILIKKITKSLQMLIASLVILFVMQVPVTFGQFIWGVESLYCYPDWNCEDQEIDVPAHVNFQVTFTNVLAVSYARGWGGTDADCPNGARVQNHVLITNDWFWVGYDHWAYELNGFNKILITVQPGTLKPTILGDPIYTAATTLYFPELCSPPPTGGGGGCYSGFTTSGERFSKKAAPESCSPCDPTPQELQDCSSWGGTYDWTWCECGASPIVIDVAGNGFNLTNSANGVLFDINGDTRQEQISWTSADSDDAWLALDRNGNGMIDDGKELFGNFTKQPTPPEGTQKNGFLALAKYDKPANGGNGDGFVTAQDMVFGNLRLWQDSNHNGISETNEQKTLSSLGLAKIELDYKESKRMDEYGNKFKYRAKVKDAQGAQIGRWAWDVFLLRGQ